MMKHLNEKRHITAEKNLKLVFFYLYNYLLEHTFITNQNCVNMPFYAAICTNNISTTKS